MIVLDPGHGGKDTGCSHNGIVEKDYVLALALHLLSVAESAGIELRSTRLADRNLGLAEAAEVAHGFGAKAVIALHVNANTSPTPSGMRCYVMPGDDVGRRIGDTILRAAPGPLFLLGRKTRMMSEIKEESDQRIVNVLKPHYEKNGAAVLVELGFATNPVDAACMKSEQGELGLGAAIIAGAVAV